MVTMNWLQAMAHESTKTLIQRRGKRRRQARMGYLAEMIEPRLLLSTATSVVLDPTAPVTYGTAVTFTATVTANSGAIAPSAGSVTFVDLTTGGTLLGTSTSPTTGTSTGPASDVWSVTTGMTQLNATTGDTIRATYNPGAGFTGNFGTVVQVVNAAGSMVSSLTDAGGTFSGLGFPAMATATGAGGLGVSTASAFTFSYVGTGGTTYGPTATPPSDAGSYMVDASYNGDTNHDASPQASTTFSISPAPSTTMIVAGGTYTSLPLTATITATGTALNDTNPADFAITYVGTGSTGYGPSAIAPTEAGSYSVTANYNGDIDHDPSSPTTVSFDISPAGSTTMVTGAGGVYTSLPLGGSVSATGLALNDTSLVDFTLSYAGRGSTHYGPTSAAPTLVGSYTVTANFNGDADHTGSTSGVVQFAITKAPSVVTLLADAGGTFSGSAFPATATAGASNPSDSFSDGTAADFNFTYTGSGTTTYGPSTTAPTNAGDYKVRASFKGDANHMVSGTSAPVLFTISKAPSTVSTLTAPGGTFNGMPFPYTAVTATGAALSDSTAADFAFSYAGTNTTSYGPASTAPTNAGDYRVTASYIGDANHLASPGNSASFTILQAPTTTTATGAGGVYTGSPLPATIAATGPVLNDTNLADFTYAYVGTGSTTYGPSITAPTNVGTYTISATYNGDPNHLTSSANNIAFAITKASSATAITASGSNYTGFPVPVRGIQVTGAAFNDTNLADVSITAYTGTGTTVYGPSLIAPTNVGTYKVTATWAGDGNHFGSTVTSPFAITIPPGAALFAHPSYAYTVNENRIANLPLGTIAATRTLPTQAITYYLTGADSSKFKINQFGVIIALVPYDILVQSSYTFNVVASVQSATAGTLLNGVPVTVTVREVAPTITGAGPDKTTVPDTSTVAPFTAFAKVVVTDAIPTHLDTATVTIAQPYEGMLAERITSIASFTAGTTPGTFTLKATPAAITSALYYLVFTPVQNVIAPNHTFSEGFTISVNDGTATTTNAATTVTFKSVEIPPTITGALAAGSTTATDDSNNISDQMTNTPFSTVTISDPEVSNTSVVAPPAVATPQPLTVTLSFPAANGKLSGGGFTFTTTGTTTTGKMVGSAAQVTSAIDALVFTPTSHQVKVGTFITSTFTIKATDGLAATPTTNAVTTVIVEATLLGASLTDGTLKANATTMAVASGTSVVTLKAADLNKADKFTFSLPTAVAMTASANNGSFVLGTGTKSNQLLANGPLAVGTYDVLVQVTPVIEAPYTQALVITIGTTGCSVALAS